MVESHTTPRADYANTGGANYKPNEFTFLNCVDIPVVNGPIYAFVKNDDSKKTQTQLVKKHFEDIVTRSLRYMKAVPEK